MARIILDIGCGKGEPMKFIDRDKRFYAIGLDIFKPYLLTAKQSRTHDDYVLCDVRKLPIRRKSVDVALCSEVLEHLDRAEGIELMKVMEEAARKQVIITTPVGQYEQQAYEDNPFQEHRHSWNSRELERLGYEVKGVGIRGVSGDRKIACEIPEILRPFYYMLWILAGVSTYHRPSYAGHMVCTKTLSEPILRLRNRDWRGARQGNA